MNSASLSQRLSRFYLKGFPWKLLFSFTTTFGHLAGSHNSLSLSLSISQIRHRRTKHFPLSLVLSFSRSLFLSFTETHKTFLSLSLSVFLSLSLPPPLSLCLCFWLCREPMCWMLLGSVSSLDMFGADFGKKDSTGGV